MYKESIRFLQEATDDNQINPILILTDMKINGMIVNPMESDINSANSSLQDSAAVVSSVQANPTTKERLFLSMANFTKEYRVHLNIVKTVFEIVPSVFSIDKLAANLGGACVSGLPHYCDVSTSTGSDVCTCLASDPPCGGPYIDDYHFGIRFDEEF